MSSNAARPSPAALDDALYWLREDGRNTAANDLREWVAALVAERDRLQDLLTIERDEVLERGKVMAARLEENEDLAAERDAFTEALRDIAETLRRTIETMDVDNLTTQATYREAEVAIKRAAPLLAGGALDA